MRLDRWLAVGLMLTGRRFDERLLYRAASALEVHLAGEGITGAEARDRSLSAEAKACLRLAGMHTNVKGDCDD